MFHTRSIQLLCRKKHRLVIYAQSTHKVLSVSRHKTLTTGSPSVMENLYGELRLTTENCDDETT